MKKRMTARIGAILTAAIITAGSVLPVCAADSTAETSETSVEVGDESFLFQLAVDGKDTVNVNPGDVITVAFTLKRTDADEAYTIYAMQNEIEYDSQFFELVEGSALVTNGIETRDLCHAGRYEKILYELSVYERR